ncbi:unnamed protein product [Prorocentrum cordatum]|uniref:Alpha-ketoglutarate-dependent dioxygenase AlkB-like domain-containing protein n=1 Tax=Prorocentrum cordatum TaxID=2364126 RepID=A0ABN9SK76_9DINO|nr:unnamed protein product [Polarella glacialis]
MRRIGRAQQYFGLVYYQTSRPDPVLQPGGAQPGPQRGCRPLGDLPAWLLPRVVGTGVFDDSAQAVNQVQANEYLRDSGIGTHVEDPAAGPAFATLSLLRPAQLTLQRAPRGRPLRAAERDAQDCVKVLMEPRSLLVLSGESRHAFAHAVRRTRLVPLRGGAVLRRGEDYRRVSLTFRAILPHECSQERRDLPAGAVPFELRPSRAGKEAAGAAAEAPAPPPPAEAAAEARSIPPLEPDPSEYEGRLEAKAAAVRGQLAEHLGGLSAPLAVVPSPPLHHRHRVKSWMYRIDDARWALKALDPDSRIPVPVFQSPLWSHKILQACSTSADLFIRNALRASQVPCTG